MSNGDKNNGVIRQIIVAVVVAFLVGGTAPWWWQEFIVKKDDPKPAPTLTPPPTSLPTPTPPEQRTAINLAYRGDDFGCSLPLSINIGDREFYPQGNLFRANEIKLGQQQYQISGQIQCATIGSCQVYGEGIVNNIPDIAILNHL